MISFSISVHIMCVTFFQHFEPQRRRFTNFHHHHSSSSSLGTSPSLGVIFDTISVKVHWEQWCRWNCDLRVINAQNQAFSVIPKASPLCWKSCVHNYAHYVTLGSRCRMASNHRVANLKKKSSSNLQGWGSIAIVSSWAFVYFLLVISSFSSLVRCVAFQSF